MKSDYFKVWDDVADAYNTATESLVAHQQKYKDVLRIIAAREPMTILDLGIGTGTLEEMLFETDYKGKVVGVEGSIEMMKIAEKKLSRKGIKLIEADLNELRVKDFNEKFEMILLINVLFCIQDADKFINKLSRLLSTGGIIIIVEPKPLGKTSNFVKSQLGGGLRSVLKMFFEAPKLIKALRISNSLDRQNKEKKIHFREGEELFSMLKSNGLVVNKSCDTQAGENILIEAVLKGG